MNQIMFFNMNVHYDSFPKIRGKLIVVNRGSVTIGKNVSFNSSLLSNMAGLYKPCTLAVEKGARLEIGDHSGMSGVSIYCAGSIRIGRYVNIGANVSVWDTDFHPLNYMDRRVHAVEKIKTSPVVIGDDAFIGAHSMILKGVTIGERAIVGAGSVVTRDIPSDEIWAGNPARFLKKNA